MLGLIAFTIRTKMRRQEIFHVMSNLTRKCSFVNFGYSREDCHWLVILFAKASLLLRRDVISPSFDSFGNLGSQVYYH